MAHNVTAGELLDGHTVLDIECLDRIYLNAYVPTLQSSGQVVAFMTQHLGKPIPSPALMEHIGTRFRRSVESYASGNGIPWVKFGKDDRKVDVMQPHIAAQAATGRSGVAAVGVSQEFQRAWSAYQRDTKAAAPQYTFAKAGRRVTCYYLYLWDEDFGPAFIKACAYFPYPAKVWVNGHEWAKRQAVKAGIGFTELSNGFASCDDPAGLQEICDRLQPGTIEVFAQRWLHRIPMPLGPADRDAGYWRECSMRQVEVSRTVVFDAPRRARSFFEALIAGNLDLGRPENVEVIFGRRVRVDTPGTFRTAIDRPVIDPDDKGVVVNIFYKRSRVKQYLKEGRAMRIETVVNCPRDLACNARLPNLDELQGKARAINRRVLEAERAGQETVLASPAFERIAHPTVDADGRRTPALRLGDPRVTALAGALADTLTAATGITSKSLRALMTGLLNTPYTPGQMTYDLRRLRLAGLIHRIEHTNRYALTLAKDRGRGGRFPLIRTPRTLPRVLNPAEVTALLTALRTSRDTAMVHAMLFGGLRRCEVLGLRLADVHLADRRLFIANGKGGHQRIVPVSGQFFTALAAYLDRERPRESATDRVFVVLKGPNRGRPLSAAGADEVLRGARARAGIAHLTCHMLRHTCLTRLREAGMALEAVQAQAGHRSIESTRIYLHLADSWLADEYARAVDAIDRDAARSSR